MLTKTSSKMLLLFLVLILAMVPVLSTAAVPDEEQIEPMSLSTVAIAFSQATITRADVIVNATTVLVPTYITATVTLQSAPLGSTNFTDVDSVRPIVETVYNTRLLAINDQFPITSTRDYRIKVEIEEDASGVTMINTKYKNLTR